MPLTFVSTVYVLSYFSSFYDVTMEVVVPVSGLCVVVSFHIRNVEPSGSFYNYFTLHKFRYFSGYKTTEHFFLYNISFFSILESKQNGK